MSGLGIGTAIENLRMECHFVRCDRNVAQTPRPHCKVKVIHIGTKQSPSVEDLCASYIPIGNVLSHRA